jgi:hypothetical protein
MALATPLGLGLFRSVGAGANFAAVTLLGLAIAAFGLSSHVGAARRRDRWRGESRCGAEAQHHCRAVLAVAAMEQSLLYAFVPLHATGHGQATYLP